ncbi:aminotransferase class I/II-fold pyridoxal phosphate-dependent enzyme [Saccharopolyspora taberi]|uniref:PLP-dependent aspartate aminotransferase family protein n=1 Tax=Saccharopolyspora taberi TaxID=60895 RepID=A0ABN3VDQ6_9PSEU
MTDFHLDTRAVHTPIPEPEGSRPLGVPIYQTHLFAFDDPEMQPAGFAGEGNAFLYNRYGNPTVRAFEEAVAGLEGGAAGLAAASGMGAINTVLLGLLGSGDHVVAQRSLYGGTLAVLRDLSERRGIEVTYVDGDDPAQVRDAVRPNSKLLWLETISNPTTRVLDLPAILGAGREAGLITVVDSTFATPVLCRPVEHGADVVVHSATKYLGGHSDVLGGIAVFADEDRYRQVRHYATELGATAAPFPAWLALRGLQTLSLRVRQHCDNAQFLAERLENHPAVDVVHYPGLDSHPDREAAVRLLSGRGGGVLSLELAGGRDAGRDFIAALRLATATVSLGDVKTLAMHPASTSHRDLDDAQLREAGIGAGLLRISAGIEHPEDLWSDVEQALKAVR